MQRKLFKEKREKSDQLGVHVLEFSLLVAQLTSGRDVEVQASKDTNSRTGRVSEVDVIESNMTLNGFPIEHDAFGGPGRRKEGVRKQLDASSLQRRSMYLLRIDLGTRVKQSNDGSRSGLSLRDIGYLERKKEGKREGWSVSGQGEEKEEGVRALTGKERRRKRQMLTMTKTAPA